MKNFIQNILVILLSVLVVFAIAEAGSLTPSADPAATSYTLDDIYTRLTTNAAATEANHDFSPTTSPAVTFHNLTQIYEAVPTIDAAKVFSGTSYLGVAGTLNLACNTSTFDSISNLVGNDYDGGGNGANRWCMTSSGDASVGDILFGKIAWVDGTAITGVIETKTLSAVNETLGAGYYASTTLSAVDADLATANIKSGKTIFGIGGDSNVVDTSSGDAAAADIAKNKIAWVDGLAITGTFDPWSVQRLQTVDDATTTNEYTAEEATWTTATTTFTGNTSIDYSDVVGDSTNIRDLASNTVKVDGRTGLWWTDAMSVNNLTTVTTTDNQFTLGNDGTRPTGGNAIGFCNALNSYNSNAGYGGYTDWYLPTQKELMQAYIDGSGNNLSTPGYYFWSSTQAYSTASYAWYTYLSNGYTNTYPKTLRYYVRCVRR